MKNKRNIEFSVIGVETTKKVLNPEFVRAYLKGGKYV